MTVASTSCVPGSTGVAASALAFAVSGVGERRGAALGDVGDPAEVEARGRRDRPAPCPWHWRSPRAAPRGRERSGRADEIGAGDLVRAGVDGRVDDRADLGEVAHGRRDRVRRRVADDRLAVLRVARRKRDEVGLDVCRGDPLRPSALRSPWSSRRRWPASAAEAVFASVDTPNESCARSGRARPSPGRRRRSSAAAPPTERRRRGSRRRRGRRGRLRRRPATSCGVHTPPSGRRVTSTPPTVRELARAFHTQSLRRVEQSGTVVHRGARP